MKNICILWHGTYPWDVRLEKFIDTLSGEYRIYVLCRGKKGLSSRGRLANVSIERVLPMSKILNYPLFFNPFWANKLYELIRKNKIETIIVRDLPLMRLGIRIGRRLGIPVIFDMAENYPAALVAYEKWYYKPFLVFNAFLPKLYEKYAIRNSRRVLVVTEEQKARINGKGVGSEKIVLVSNTPELGKLPRSKADESAYKEKRILYTGKVDIHRGVETAIRAVSKLIVSYPEVKLIIAGDGREATRLQELALSLGLGQNIEFAGWVDHSKVYEMIQDSHICLIPHLKSEHTDTTLPNKLFDYMALGKPVISSNIRPVARVLNQCHCGLVFESGNPDSLAEKLENLFANANSSELGENGRKKVLQEYNWEIDSERLKKLVREVCT
jgi:glycosyltransferase involved in cell wall biosynthesis